LPITYLYFPGWRMLLKNSSKDSFPTVPGLIHICTFTNFGPLGALNVIYKLFLTEVLEITSSDYFRFPFFRVAFLIR